MKNFLCICGLLCSIQLNAQTKLAFSKIEINTGAVSSYPSKFQVFKGKLIFFADDGTHGYEPWISDGTTLGTVFLKDLNVRGKYPKVTANKNLGTDAMPFIEIDSYLYFNAHDSALGQVLFRTDGTPVGTVIALSGISWVAYSFPAKFGNTMLFSQSVGLDLWSTDGTQQGTFILKDLPGINPWPRYFCEHKGKMYFTARDSAQKWDLWETDGTEQGTVLIQHFEDVYNIFSLDNKLYFVARTQSDGLEWFVHTGGAPQLIRDINLNADSGAVMIEGEYEIKAYKNKAYFGADDGNSGVELWVTDGTYAGTRLVKDINPGAASSNPHRFTEHDGKLYFAATDAISGRELWVTDGTDTGTRLVGDIRPGNESSFPARFKSYGKHLYFSANNASADTQLFRTDGTDTGTTVIAPPGSTKPNPLGSSWCFIVYDSSLYFGADFDSSGMELWSLREIPDPDYIPVTVEDRNVFAVYPNPAEDALYIRICEDFGNAQLSVYDAAGKLMPIQNIDRAGNTLVLVLPPGMPPGNYIVSVRINGHTSGVTFVKQ